MTLIHRFTQGASLLACTGAAMAHGGHGMGDVHWHATDTAGFVFVAVVSGAVIWLSRRK